MKRLRKLLPIALIVAMLLVLFPARVAFAATLLDVSDVLSSNTASTANVSHTVRFTIPSGGSALTASSVIDIDLAGFTVASGYDGTVTVTDDGSSVSLDGTPYTVSGDNITVALNASIAANSLVKVILAGGSSGKTINNPVATTYTVTVETRANGSSASDSGNTTVAIEADTVDYQFGVNAGSLILSTVASNFGDITLGPGKMSITSDETWQAIDARGNGNGWHITVSVGDLTDGTKTLTRNDNRTFSNNNIYAVEVMVETADMTQTVASDGSTPVSELAGNGAYTYITSGGITVVTAAATEGMGRYTITPHMRFTIPFGTYTDDGTNYVVTMTIDIVNA